MLRRSTALVVAALLLATVFVPQMVVAQEEGPPAVPDTMVAYSIVPPGQEGDVTAEEAAAGDFGPHYADQRDMYANLINDDDVTNAELGDYFHSMQFGPEGEIEDTYEPTEGVTVYRDSMGIPHIYAENLAAASFALGYVTAEDRMWESDVFRHAARGTLSEFIGPDYLEMDILTRREGYTEEEIQKIFDDFPKKFGAVGTQVQEGLQAYADGWNEKKSELMTAPQNCPAEYQALGNPCPAQHPADWSPLDTLFLAVLQLRVFGETAGGELQNAALYKHLKDKLGNTLGPKVFEDLLRRNDPRSPTTIPAGEGRFPSQDLGRTKAASLAIPDNAIELAQDAAAADAAREEFLASMGFKSPASNAILVGAKESKTGNPMEWGAPQVGYATPSFFMDVDVHVPTEGVHFRGPAVPGASALIPLGRGPDYAWSLTTGYSDAVDTRAELLCDPAGGEATQDSNGYMFKGECKEMESREETFVVKPSAASTGPPDIHTETIYRTIHGPVFARTNVDNKPVALVKERFFWLKELDAIPEFFRWNTKTQNIGDFKAAASRFTMSFNTFYADHEHIGYFHIGHYPKRARGVHPALPIWGTGEWEWRGRIPFRLHPKVVDPAQGWVANWNNKPAVGWDNYDGIKWGPIQRVALLQRQMKKFTRGPKKAVLSDLVDAARIAATQDARGVFLGPKMLNMATAGPADLDDAIAIVRQWVKAGAHRLNRDWDGDMNDDGDPDDDEMEDNGPAAVIFDTWFELLVDAVFKDELGEEGFDLVPTPINDFDQWHDFSSFLQNVFNSRASRALARPYCDDMGTTDKKETCGALVISTLQAALEAISADQGTDMTAWTTGAYWNPFEELGLGSVRQMAWQNRGTHNHIVEILRRANDGPTGGGGSASPSPSPSES